MRVKAAAIQRRQQRPPIATWRRSFTFFPDDAVLVAGLFESVGCWVAVEGLRAELIDLGRG
jgi:hypothetical protein